MELKTISMEMESPTKFNFKDIEFNKLSIFVGTNASGKSFIMKMLYFMSQFALTLYVLEDLKKLNPGKISTSAEDIGKDFLKNVFENPEELKGVVKVDWDKSSLTINFNNGELSEIIITGFQEYQNIPPIRYMSTNIRLFSDIKRYLQLRKINSDSTEAIPNIIEHMLKYYKLFDVEDVERLIKVCSEDYTIPQSFYDTIGKDDNNPPISLKIDLSVDDFIVTFKDGTKRNASALSNGYQAMLHMSLSSSIK